MSRALAVLLTTADCAGVLRVTVVWRRSGLTAGGCLVALAATLCEGRGQRSDGQDRLSRDMCYNGDAALGTAWLARWLGAYIELTARGDTETAQRRHTRCMRA